jgi:hypothetical protein
MGSSSDMAATNRAVAVLDKAPADQHGYPILDLRGYVGQKVTVAEVFLGSEQLASISAQAKLITESGEHVWVSLGTVAELADTGVCGYALEEYFESHVLRTMLESAIADEANGLDLDDRDALREDIEQYLTG